MLPAPALDPMSFVGRVQTVAIPDPSDRSGGAAVTESSGSSDRSPRAAVADVLVGTDGFHGYKTVIAGVLRRIIERSGLVSRALRTD